MRYLSLIVFAVLSLSSSAAEALTDRRAVLKISEADFTAQPVFFLPKYHGVIRWT